MLSCCICNSVTNKNIITLHSDNLQPSSLYKTINICCCTKCGHVFNPINDIDEYGIIDFYNDEYSPSSISSPGQGDMPGGDSKYSIMRYESLYNVIKDIRAETILDVGCAMGGYLSFLRDKGCSGLYGTDLCSSYVVEAMKRNNIVIRQGTAESIPFDMQFDLVVSNQVVEHLFNPNIFFSEVKRILKPNGHLCINVPDAYAYPDNSFFEYFWFIIREHVHHFDETHMRYIASKYGFVCEKISRINTPMLSETARLPNLTILFRNTNNLTGDFGNDQNLGNRLSTYCQSQNSHAIERKSKIGAIDFPIYVWGMSREFMYLYGSAGLDKCNIVDFVDDTPIKQSKTINGRKVISSSVFGKDKNIPILITAFAHMETLSKKAERLGHRLVKI